MSLPKYDYLDDFGSITGNLSDGLRAVVMSSVGREYPNSIFTGAHHPLGYSRSHVLSFTEANPSDARDRPSRLFRRCNVFR